MRAIDAGAAGFVHWGATSQDVVDTAFVRLVNRAVDVIDEDQKAWPARFARCRIGMPAT